ncbi:MAG: hypothetical protein ACXAB7_22020 [Candidatus Kariarchaeaceae archaeon]|jgi:endonuclease III-like uncharacterized protein
MTKRKVWTTDVELTSILPINLSLPKAYVLANVPFNAEVWSRVFIYDNNQLVVARATQLKPMSKKIQLTIESRKKPDPVLIDDVTRKIRFEIGIDEKMEVLRDLQSRDPMVRIAVRSNPGFRIYANSNVQEAAILTIMSQNTSFFKYLQSVKALYDTYGVIVPWDDNLKGFPSNEVIANISPNEWKALGVGYKYKFLANLTINDLENFEIYANYPILDRGLQGLLDINGVGQYTSRCLLIYTSRRYSYAFLDSYVNEVLNHKYEFMGITTIRDYDNWIHKRWPDDPALVVHALLQEYLPVYLQITEDI